MSNKKIERNYPYGGYDPFKTPSAKQFANSTPAVPDRPPFQQGWPSFNPPAPTSMNYQQHMPFPGHGPMPFPMPMPFGQQPGMFGYPPNQQQGYQNTQQKPQSNWNIGSTISGANQVMGIMKQLGGLASFFK
ncbi:hypothetical protein ACFQPF_03040 [Fictibacillus iocasae]|uniref:Spore coat protein n=1 Tax=Fictibacillus iocasae TaxID=2715437 RepID=A0ABW2NLG7_9BACL